MYKQYHKGCTIDPAVIKKITRKYYEQLYDDINQKKWNNSQKPQTPKLNQDKIDNLNNLVTIKQIEVVIKKLFKKKYLGRDGFTGEFY